GRPQATFAEFLQFRVELVQRRAGQAARTADDVQAGRGRGVEDLRRRLARREIHQGIGVGREPIELLERIGAAEAADDHDVGLVLQPVHHDSANAPCRAGDDDADHAELGLPVRGRITAAAFTAQGGPATRGAAARPVGRRLASRSIAFGTSFAEAARGCWRTSTFRLAPRTAVSISVAATAIATAAAVATVATAPA